MFRAGESAGELVQIGVGIGEFGLGRGDLGGDFHGAAGTPAGNEPAVPHKHTGGGDGLEAGVGVDDGAGAVEGFGPHDVGEQAGNGGGVVGVDVNVVDEPGGVGRQVGVEVPDAAGAGQDDRGAGHGFGNGSQRIPGSRVEAGGAGDRFAECPECQGQGTVDAGGGGGADRDVLGERGEFVGDAAGFGEGVAESTVRHRHGCPQCFDAGFQAGHVPFQVLLLGSHLF